MKRIPFFLAGILLGAGAVYLYLYILAKPNLMAHYLAYLIYGPPVLHELEAQMISFWQSVDETVLEWTSFQPKELLDQLGASLQGPPQNHKDPP